MKTQKNNKTEQPKRKEETTGERMDRLIANSVNGQLSPNDPTHYRR